jgi:hypothetical protein
VVTTHLAFFFFHGMGGEASPDVTRPLTGEASNSAAGTLTPSSDVPVLGEQFLAEAGDLVAEGGDVAAPAAPQGGRRGRRYRIIEDPDLLCEELVVEEKKVEVEKKKLRVLIKRSESPNVEGVLYQQIQEKIEKLEAKIDDRLEKIAGLMLAIQVALDEQDDDEEEVLLMS